MYFCPLPWILASKRWIFLSGNETCLAHLFWGLQLNVEGYYLSFLSTTTFFSFEGQEIKAVLCCLWQAFSLIDPDSVFPWKSPSHLDSAFERKLRCCTCILMFCGCLAVCKPEYVILGHILLFVCRGKASWRVLVTAKWLTFSNLFCLWVLFLKSSTREIVRWIFWGFLGCGFFQSHFKLGIKVGNICPVFKSCAFLFPFLLPSS